MKRRNFLRSAGTTAALTPLVYNGFSINPLSSNSVFSQIAAAATINGRVMVFIELAGGNDGINTLIPLDQYSHLSNHREHLLIPENNVLKLDGIDATGFHPSMSGLRELYDEGLMSIVQNVGYPQQDYSHFRSMDIWMTGSDSNEYLGTGWLGRTLEGEYPGFPQGYPNADFPDPLAIQIGSITPIAFMGASYPMGMAISSADEFYDFVNDFVEPAPAGYYGDELDYIRLVMNQSQQYYDSLKTAAENSTNLSDKYPNTNLANQLRIVARLINGGLQTPVYVVSIGGFDTHSEQIGSDMNPLGGFHAQLLNNLSESICAFQDDLQLMGVDDKVCGMTFSEFGRTIGENGSFGTDHGAAAPLLVFGKNVNPGIIGDNPVIPATIQNSQDLPMVHDFRQVYASVLQDWFGIEDWQGILNDDFDILPIFKGVTSTETVAGQGGDPFQVTNYPNPVRTSTTIAFSSPGAFVTINLLDAQGRQILQIAQGQYPVGFHRVVFDRSSLNSGTYFYQVKLNGVAVTKKMLVL